MNQENPQFCRRKEPEFDHLKNKLVSNCFKNRILTKINLGQVTQDEHSASKMSKKPLSQSFFESRVIKHSKDHEVEHIKIYEATDQPPVARDRSSKKEKQPATAEIKVDLMKPKVYLDPRAKSCQLESLAQPLPQTLR